MGKLHLFLFVTIAIHVVTPLPQFTSDWDLFNSAEPMADGSSSLLPTDDSNLFSSNTDLVTSNQGVDLNTYQVSPTLGGDMLWTDSGSYLPPDVIASGCSGGLGKRGDACSVTQGGTTTEDGTVAQEETQGKNPCEDDKEAQCCRPSFMWRSRWPGGGFNMDGCTEREYPILGDQPAASNLDDLDGYHAVQGWGTRTPLTDCFRSDHYRFLSGDWRFGAVLRSTNGERSM